jgi:hypothetical protein
VNPSETQSFFFNGVRLPYMKSAISTICAFGVLSPTCGYAADVYSAPAESSAISFLTARGGSTSRVLIAAATSEVSATSSSDASTKTAVETEQQSPDSSGNPETGTADTSDSDTTANSNNSSQETGNTANGGTRTSGAFSVPGLQKDMPLLRGQASTFKGRSPFLSGSIQSIPADTKVELVVPDGTFLNSEFSQKGDEVRVRVAKDIMDGDRVLIPGGWYMRGLVTQAVGRQRTLRNGWVEVQFDKLVSPDGDYELDFNAKVSTKDNKLTAVSKLIAKDVGFVSYGALGGALLSIQLGGIGTAIATHGISVGVGAAIGGTIGQYAAIRRKGKINSITGGDTLKLVTAEPISLPGFDKELLPSAEPIPHLEGLELKVKDFRFARTSWNDSSARVLTVDLDVANNTKLNFNFFDVFVKSDHDQTYIQTYGGLGGGAKNPTIAPGKSGSGKIVFTVGSPKRKYSLIFVSRRTGKELSRVAIN